MKNILTCLSEVYKHSDKEDKVLHKFDCLVIENKSMQSFRAMFSALASGKPRGNSSLYKQPMRILSKIAEIVPSLQSYVRNKIRRLRSSRLGKFGRR